MKYLDFLINKNSLCMNSSHVKTISDWHFYLFKIFYDIQIFIEFCNFYQQFIYNFADIAQFLHLLLHDMKKDRKSDLIANEWQTFQQETFEQLINAFISASVLHHYNFQHKLWMKTDASESVYADILSQQWKNRWHSIVYFSRKFSSSELNYSIYNKKLIAIVMNFRQWKHYLENVFKIEVWSDYVNLKQFIN